jgi:8-oxoguanine deaminase
MWSISEPADRPIRESEERISLRGCIVAPGFINLHHHFFQSFTRAVLGSENSSVLTWLLALYPVWVHLDPTAMVAATRVAAARRMHDDADHSYLVPYNDAEVLEQELAAARDMGLRLHLVVGAAPTLEGDLERQLTGTIGRNVHRLIADEQDILNQMDRFAREHHDTRSGAMTRIAFGPTGVTHETSLYGARGRTRRSTWVRSSYPSASSP